MMNLRVCKKKNKQNIFLKILKRHKKIIKNSRIDIEKKKFGE